MASACSLNRRRICSRRAMPKAAAALSRNSRLEVGRVEMVGGVAAQAADGDPAAAAAFTVPLY